MIEEITYVDIFLSSEIVYYIKNKNYDEVNTTDNNYFDEINHQSFAMAYDIENKWLYGKTASNFAKRYPERAILSFSKLLHDETEIQIAEYTFSPISLIVYFLQQIDYRVKQSTRAIAPSYTITVSNDINLVQRETIIKAMNMASMKIDKILRHTDQMAVYSNYLSPNIDANILYLFIQRSSCDLGLYNHNGNIIESIAKDSTVPISDASFIPLLTSNLLHKYIETGKDYTLINYPHLVKESERIIASLDVEGIRKVSFIEANSSKIEYSLHIESDEIYSWIKSPIEKIIYKIEQILTLTDNSTPLKAICVDTETSSYNVLKHALKGRIQTPIQDAIGYTKKGVGIHKSYLHGYTKDRLFLDSFPYEISTILQNGNVLPILKKHTTIPTKCTTYLWTSSTQSLIEIPLFANGTFIGGQLISVNSRQDTDDLKIEITIEIDHRGIVTAFSSIEGLPHTETTLQLPTPYAAENYFTNKNIFVSSLKQV